jgi:hypothetical protein
MTEAQARTTANILLGAAAIGAAVLIVRTPALRRLAWHAARTAIATTGPAWLATEVRRAWNETAPAAGHPAGVGPREPRDMISA